MEKIPQGQGSEKRGSAAPKERVANVEREFANFQPETKAQKSAQESADKIALWGVRLNLVRGEIANAKEKGETEKLAGLEKREQILEQEMLEMNGGSAN